MTGSGCLCKAKKLCAREMFAQQNVFKGEMLSLPYTRVKRRRQPGKMFMQKSVAFVQDSNVHKKDGIKNRRSAAGAGLRVKWKGPGGTCALPCSPSNPGGTRSSPRHHARNLGPISAPPTAHSRARSLPI